MTTTIEALPVWAKAVAMIGFPSVVALFFLFQDAGVIPSLAQANAQALKEMAATTEDWMRIQRQICHNTSKTAEDHRNCW